MWIYKVDAGGTLFQTSTNTGSMNGFTMYVAANGGIGIYAREYHVINESSNSGSITSNTWHHVALVIEGLTAKLYVDGVLKSTGEFTLPRSIQNSDRTYIGGDVYR